MEKRLTKSLEDYAVRRKIGLWRTHPSFFFVALFYVLEGLVVGSLFIFDGSTTNVYQNLFKYIPEDLFGSFFLIGVLILIFALLSRKHIWLRVGVGVLLIPNMMMIANFLLLITNTYSGGLLVATFKWGLTCLMLFEMLYEPFVDPNNAR